MKPPLSLREVQREQLLRVLRGNGWNKSLAAKTLGVDRRTIHRMVERWQVRRSLYIEPLATELEDGAGEPVEREAVAAWRAYAREVNAADGSELHKGFLAGFGRALGTAVGESPLSGGGTLSG